MCEGSVQGHVEVGVHRVRFPAKENNSFVAVHSAFNLGKHALFGAFNDFKAIKAKMALATKTSMSVKPLLAFISNAPKRWQVATRVWSLWG